MPPPLSLGPAHWWGQAGVPLQPQSGGQCRDARAGLSRAPRTLPRARPHSSPPHGSAPGACSHPGGVPNHLAGMMSQRCGFRACPPPLPPCGGGARRPSSLFWAVVPPNLIRPRSGCAVDRMGEGGVPHSCRPACLTPTRSPPVPHQQFAAKRPAGSSPFEPDNQPKMARRPSKPLAPLGLDSSALREPPAIPRRRLDRCRGGRRLTPRPIAAPHPGAPPPRIPNVGFEGGGGPGALARKARSHPR